MAAIKGQNLRLFLNGEVIAGAKSCNVHVAVNMQDASSKDDQDGWANQVPVGLSWDVSADALVIVGTQGTQYVASQNSTVQGKVIFAPSQVFTVEPGACLRVETTDDRQTAYIFDSNAGKIIASGKHVVEWVNEYDEEVDLNVGCDADHANITVIYDPNIGKLEHFEHMIAEKTPVNVQFASVDEDFDVGDWDGFSGVAYITDISVNSPDKQLTTYTVKLTGTGELAEN